MVTGANAGIGRETALALARSGATVVMVSRNRERGEAARAGIVAQSGNERVELLLADLSSQHSIRAMCDDFNHRYDRLNVLVNNAGVYLSERHVTADGLEMTFATNHLGYFMPTVLLWERLLAGAPARVINVSSDAHRSAKLNFDDLQNEHHYKGFRAYAQSKLANVLFTQELHRRRGAADVTANTLHPGFVASNFGRDNGGIIGLFMRRVVPWFARSSEEGAATSIYLASSAEVAGISGGYFVDCKPVRAAATAYDTSAAARLWQVSEALTGVSIPTALALPGK